MVFQRLGRLPRTAFINWGLSEDFYRDITARTVVIAKKYGKKSERWLMGYYKQPKDWNANK